MPHSHTDWRGFSSVRKPHAHPPAHWIWAGRRDVAWLSAETQQPSHGLKRRSKWFIVCKKSEGKVLRRLRRVTRQPKSSCGFQEGLSGGRRSLRGLAAGPGQPQISVVICCGFASRRIISGLFERIMRLFFTYAHHLEGQCTKCTSIDFLHWPMHVAFVIPFSIRGLEGGGQLPEVIFMTSAPSVNVFKSRLKSLLFFPYAYDWAHLFILFFL